MVLYKWKLSCDTPIIEEVLLDQDLEARVSQHLNIITPIVHPPTRKEIPASDHYQANRLA